MSLYDRMMKTVSCVRCGEVFQPGDEYYDTGDRCYCPDCWEAFAESLRHIMES